MVFKVIAWAFGGVTQFSLGSPMYTEGIHIIKSVCFSPVTLSFITGGAGGGGEGSTKNLEGYFSSPASSLKARTDLVTY